MDRFFDLAEQYAPVLLKLYALEWLVGIIAFVIVLCITIGFIISMLTKRTRRGRNRNDFKRF